MSKSYKITLDIELSDELEAKVAGIGTGPRDALTNVILSVFSRALGDAQELVEGLPGSEPNLDLYRLDQELVEACLRSAMATAIQHRMTEGRKGSLGETGKAK